MRIFSCTGASTPAARVLPLALISSFLLASGPASAVLTTHPRMWLTPARLSQLKTYAAQNTLRWQNLQTFANKELTDSNADEFSVAPLALCYQVTGNTAYAKRAIQLMVGIAVSSNDISGDSHYGYRSTIPEVTAGYDWCFDQMTVAQRQQIATWLMDRTDEIWPETNPAQVGGWAVDSPSNNYFWGYYTTWAAALAVYGDGTDTGTDPYQSPPPSGTNRPNYHLNLALSKWTSLVRPFTDGWGAGGVFMESTNYDSSFLLSLILDAYLTANGTDLINQTGFNFVHDSLYWRIYSATPGMDQYYSLGDQPRDSSGPLSDYDRDRALVATATLADTKLTQYAKYWLDNITPSTSQWDFTQVWEFLLYNEGLQSVDYRTQLPTWYFASGPGVLIRRSDWTPNATYWGIWAGPLQETHQDHNVNGFLIYKSGWLASNANMYSQSGIIQDTDANNNYTFGGNEQWWQYPDSSYPNEAGKVLIQENTNEYTYFAGWGAQAYVQDRSHGGTPIASDYVRKIAYISPNTFLVYDRVSLLNSTFAKEYHLHSQTAITTSGRTYKFDNGAYRLWGQSLLPTSGVTVSTTPEYNGANGAKSSYRLDVVTSRNQVTDYMLNVLQVAPLSQTSVATPLVMAATNMDGAQVGNWVVLFGKTEQISGTITYNLNASAVTQHLVLDLLPSRKYRVRIFNTRRGTTLFATVTSTGQGSLRFAVPSGPYRITLTPS